MIKSFLLIMSACAMLMSAAIQAEAAYPDRTIKLIVPSSPGGAADFLARIISPGLSRQLGQTIIVENKPGASGTIAANMIARSKPDGYTLDMAQAASIVAAPYIYKQLPYDPLKDLAPVALVAEFPYILEVNAKSDIKSLADLIAKAKAKPGTVTFGSAGLGTPSHLAGEMLQEMAGIKMIHVPYKGAGPAANALLANQIDTVFVVSSSAIPMLKGKQVRALAISTARRAASAPNIPTVAELGYAGFGITSWFGMFAPAGTPPDIIEKLNRNIAQTLKDPKVEKYFQRLAIEAGSGSPAQFAGFIDSENRTAKRLITGGQAHAAK